MRPTAPRGEQVDLVHSSSASENTRRFIGKVALFTAGFDTGDKDEREQAAAVQGDLQQALSALQAELEQQQQLVAQEQSAVRSQLDGARREHDQQLRQVRRGNYVVARRAASRPVWYVDAKRTT